MLLELDNVWRRTRVIDPEDFLLILAVYLWDFLMIHSIRSLRVLTFANRTRRKWNKSANWCDSIRFDWVDWMEKSLHWEFFSLQGNPLIGLSETTVESIGLGTGKLEGEIFNVG